MLEKCAKRFANFCLEYVWSHGVFFRNIEIGGRGGTLPWRILVTYATGRICELKSDTSIFSPVQPSSGHYAIGVGGTQLGIVCVPTCMKVIWGKVQTLSLVWYGKCPNLRLCVCVTLQLNTFPVRLCPRCICYSTIFFDRRVLAHCLQLGSACRKSRDAAHLSIVSLMEINFSMRNEHTTFRDVPCAADTPKQ